MDPNPSHKYAAILRCRTWGNWPEDCHFTSTSLRYEHKTGLPVFVTAGVRCYERRERPENEPAPECQKAKGPILYRGDMQTGYHLGQYILKAPEDILKIEFQHFPPHKGEIDILILMGIEEELSQQELIKFAKPLVYSLVSQVNITLGEYLVPIAPLNLRKLLDGGSSFENEAQIAIRARPTISDKEINTVLSKFIARRTESKVEATRCLDVSMKRFLNAQLEDDPIDKYYDLWETCEFASLGRELKGDVVSRISQCLTSHISCDSLKVKKSRLENQLEVRTLYKTRGNIVHNAIEFSGEIDEKLSLLQEIASELIKYQLGIPWSGNPTLERLLA